VCVQENRNTSQHAAVGGDKARSAASSVVVQNSLDASILKEPFFDPHVFSNNKGAPPMHRTPPRRGNHVVRSPLPMHALGLAESTNKREIVARTLPAAVEEQQQHTVDGIVLPPAHPASPSSSLRATKPYGTLFHEKLRAILARKGLLIPGGNQDALKSPPTGVGGDGAADSTAAATETAQLPIEGPEAALVRNISSLMGAVGKIIASSAKAASSNAAAWPEANGRRRRQQRDNGSSARKEGSSSASAANADPFWPPTPPQQLFSLADLQRLHNNPAVTDDGLLHRSSSAAARNTVQPPPSTLADMMADRLLSNLVAQDPLKYSFEEFEALPTSSSEILDVMLEKLQVQ
jgi:hypothetical protein